MNASVWPQGWADESEFIRETSLQAGQTIVSRYADTAMELFLPELENGLFNENWRIRYSTACSELPLCGHSNAWIQHVFKQWSSQLCTRYLGLGMRYEAGICTIVISMKRTFN